ncbi:prostate stem cell antigen-like, partial [Lampetra fluviatilis]
ITKKITKGCNSKEICAAISVANFAGTSFPYCCNTDLCNDNGGLTCYKCDDQISNDQCTMANSIVDCSASGQQCYANKNPLTNKISKGCGSKEACAAISAANNAGLTNSYCCDTDRCNKNGASTLAPSLITSAPLMAASILAAILASTRLAAF